MQKIKILAFTVLIAAVIVFLGSILITIELKCMKGYGHLSIPIKGSIINGCEMLTNQGWIPAKEILNE